ncbi:MAG: DUF1049 domain-containing protein [Bauldia sp.]|nr:DUF1049 domain-containing protein [Bauldia sp.]
MRRFITLLILVPLAVIVVFFSVANRQSVTVSLDPFHDGTPALSFAAPLFVLMFGAIVIGLLLGGVAAWTRQGRWRRAARRAEREAEQLRADAAARPAALPAARDAA